MKRILHLIDTTGPGGAETIFIELVRSTAASGSVSIPVVQGSGWVMDTLRMTGIEPLVLASGSRFDIRYLRQLRSVMLRERIDLVHAHLSTTALYGGLAARSLGIPSLATFHGPPDLATGRLLDRVRLILIRWATDGVVFVSESLRDEAIQRKLVAPDRAWVVYNGIDTRQFSPQRSAPPGRSSLRRTEDEVLIGAVGNIRPLKDYPTLLRAAARVRGELGKPVRFVIAGATDSTLYEELRHLRTQCGMTEDDLCFLGFIDDIPGLLRELDIFVLTSSREGFSLATVQALATGLPVVVTRSGGPEEIVTNGSEGFLVPPEDPIAVAEALSQLIRDPETRRCFGQRARKTAVRRFSLDRMLAGYSDLYASLMNDPVEEPAAGSASLH